MAGGAAKLELDQAGRLDGLKVHAVKRIPPHADQVEVRVIAAGAQFQRRAQGDGHLPGSGR